MESDSPIALLKSADTMATWSEEKKQEFTQLFSNRTRIAQILLEITVSKLATMAKNRHFISDYHLTKLRRSTGWEPNNDYKYRFGSEVSKCGRQIDEILRIAEGRAKTLLAELPPLKKAVNVINPEVAKKIDKISRLQKKAEELQEKLEELPTSIDMEDEEYQDLTVRVFRAEVQKLFDERKKLLKGINAAGTEAHDLEVAVSKALYKGLPGLSDAVIDVLKAHIERGAALGQMKRRVSEQVKFGDSDAATGLLHQFEQDEASVSDELKGKLNAALATLKASVKALPKKKRASKAKALPAKKKAKKGSK